MKINLTGSTLTYSVSMDGVTWIPLASEAITTPFTTAPNQIGFGQINASGDTVSLTLAADWFRRTV